MKPYCRKKTTILFSGFSIFDLQRNSGLIVLILMAYPPHIHYEGAVYHVTARGVRQEPIFLDDDDREYFISLLEKLKQRYKFYVLSCCLMTNHFHLVVRVTTVSLSRIMQVLLNRYAKRFNKKTGKSGHVFEEKFYRRLVRDDQYLGVVIGYVHGNPVKAGMVSKTTDWEWSTARQFAERTQGLADINVVAELLGGEDSLEILAEPISDVPSEAYIDQRLAVFDEPEGPEPDFDEVAHEVLAGSAWTVEDLKRANKNRELGRFRMAFFREAVSRGALNSRAAGYLNRSPAAVTRALAAESKIEKPEN